MFSVCAVELNREPQKSYGVNFSAEFEAIAPDKGYLGDGFSLTSASCLGPTPCSFLGPPKSSMLDSFPSS
jgi:hypothetical protein